MSQTERERFRKDPISRSFVVGPGYVESDIDDNCSASTAESAILMPTGVGKLINHFEKRSSSETQTISSAVTVTITQEPRQRSLATPFVDKALSTLTPATEEYNTNANVRARQSLNADDSNIDTPHVLYPRQLSDSVDSNSFSPGKFRSYGASKQVNGSDEVLRDSKSAKVSDSTRLSKQGSISLVNRDILNTSMSSTESLRRSHDSTVGYLQKAAQDVSMMSMTSSQELEYQSKILTYQKDIDDMHRIRDTMTEQMDIFRREKTLLLKKIDRLEDEKDRLLRAEEDAKILEKMLRDKAEIQSWSNVEGMKEELESVKSENEKLNQELEALRSENEDLRKQVESVDVTAENLEKEITKFERTKEQLTAETRTLRDEKAELTSLLNQTKQDQKQTQESWEQQRKEFQTLRQTLADELEVVQSSKSALEAEMLVLRSELQEQATSMTEKEGQFEVSLLKMSEELDESRSLLASHQQLVDNQKSDFETARLLSLEQWQQERDSFVAEAVKASEDRQQLTSELEQLRTNLCTNDLTLSKQMTALNVEALNQQQRITDLTKALEDVQSEVRSNEAVLKSRQDEVAELHKKIEAQQQRWSETMDEHHTVTRQHELDSIEWNQLVRRLREELTEAEKRVQVSEEQSRVLTFRVETLQTEAQRMVQAHSVTISELETRHSKITVGLNNELSETQTRLQDRTQGLQMRVEELQSELKEIQSKSHSFSDQIKYSKQLEVEKTLREELRQVKAKLLGVEDAHKALQVQHDKELQIKSDELMALSVSLGDLRAKLEAAEVTREVNTTMLEATGVQSLRSSWDHSVLSASASAAASAAVNEEVADVQLKLIELHKKYYQIKNDNHEQMKKLKNDHNKELSEMRINSKTEAEGLLRDLEVLRSELTATVKDKQSTVDELADLKQHLFGVEQEVVKARLESTIAAHDRAKLEMKNTELTKWKKETKAQMKAFIPYNNAKLASLKDLLSMSSQTVSSSSVDAVHAVSSMAEGELKREVNWDEVIPLAEKVVARQRHLESELERQSVDAQRQVKDLQRALKEREEELQEAHLEAHSAYSTQSQTATQLQNKLQATQESSAAFQREIEDLQSKLEVEQKKRFECEDRCMLLEAMKLEILNQQVTLIQESDTATLDLRKLVDMREEQLRSLEVEKQTLSQDLNKATQDRAALESKLASEKLKLSSELNGLREELKQVRGSAAKESGEWQAQRMKLERDLSRVSKDLEQSKLDRQALDLKCSSLSRDILNTLQTMPLANASTAKSVTATPHNSVEKGDLELTLKSILNIATLKSMTLYETLESHTLSGKILKQEIEQYTDSFLQMMERVFDDETSSSTDSSTSGVAGAFGAISSGGRSLVSCVHINKYPQLCQPENCELNQTLLHLEKRVLDAVFQAENARSYLGVETQKVVSLQSQLHRAEGTIADLEQQLSSLKEQKHAVTVSEDQQKQALQEGKELKQELQKYSNSIAELIQSRKEYKKREDELIAKLLALTSRYDAVLAEKTELQQSNSDLSKQLNATSSELHQMKLSNTQNSQRAQLLDAELVILRSKLLEVSAEKQAVAIKLSSVESAAATATMAHESLLQLKTRLETEVTRLRSEIESLSMNQTSSVHEKKQWEFKEQQLVQTVASLNAALADKDLKWHQFSVNELSDTVSRWESENGILRKERDNLAEEKQRMQAWMKDAVRQWESENGVLKKERDSLAEEKQRMQSRILEFDSQLSREQSDEDTLLKALHGTKKAPENRSVAVTRNASESAASTSTTTNKVTHSDLDLEGDIMGGFEKLLKERRRLRRTCSSQQLCILSLRLLLKEAELASSNLSVSELQNSVGSAQTRN